MEWLYLVTECDLLTLLNLPLRDLVKNTSHLWAARSFSEYFDYLCGLR